MKRVWQAMLIVAFAGTLASAQDKPPHEPQPNQDRPLSFYKIEYVLRELQDGKAINSRSYMMTVKDRETGKAKVGARVPTPTSPGPTGGIVTSQYFDMGINLWCRVIGSGDYASLETTIEISTFALPEQATKTGSQPVVRQMQTEMVAVVPLGKQTAIGYMDDANSTKRYEIAVTATRMK